ncbi:MAG: Stringent starvation protein [Frankiales bacterium]|nr:Stringent starvation protein [Frankiales bacterium]
MTEWETRLHRRIEELVASADDDDQAESARTRAELAELRSDIADALEAVRDRLADNLGSLRGDLSGLRDAVTVLLGAVSDNQDSGRDLVQQSIGEARDLLEERLATLEDALESLSDRLEALARDGVTETSDRLGSIVESMRLLPAQVAESTDDTAVREALTELAAAVDRGLADLGSRLSIAVAETGAADRTHVETELVALRADLADALEEVRDRLNDNLGQRVTQQTGDLLDRLDEGIAVLGRRLGELAEPVSATAAVVASNDERLGTVEESIGEMHEELTAISSEWSSRTTAVVEQARAAGEAAADAVGERAQAAIATVEENIGAILEENRAENAETSKEARALVKQARTAADDVAAVIQERAAAIVELMRAEAQTVLEQFRTEAQGAFDEVKAESTTTAREARKVSEQARNAVEAVQSTLQEQTAVLVERLRTDVASVLEDTRRESREASAEVRAALTRSTGAVTKTHERMETDADRLADAGRGLLAYLAERDRVLEAERMTVLHEVLDDFAEGLSVKERKRAADRLGDAMRRRREARDAERWRKQQGAPTDTGVPPDLSTYLPPAPGQGAEAPDEPPIPSSTPPSRRRPGAIRPATAPRRDGPPSTAGGSADAPAATPSAPGTATAATAPAKAPVKATPAKTAPVKAPAVKSAPRTKPAPTKAAAPKKAAAAKKTPAKQVPGAQAPAKQVPGAPAPAKQTPAKQAPGAQTSTETTGPREEIRPNSPQS